MGVRYLGFAMFLLVSCFLVLGGITAVADSNCSSIVDPGIILVKCITYIKKFGSPRQPSSDCCSVMKIGNIVPCICQKPPPKFEIIVNMEKFVHVATTCGSQTPPSGQKCGSYTIPSAPAPVGPSPPVQPPPPAPIRPSPPVPRQSPPPAPIRPSPPIPRSPVQRPPRRSPPPRRRSPPLP